VGISENFKQRPNSLKQNLLAWTKKL
jgi:hypothetical protein